MKSRKRSLIQLMFVGLVITLVVLAFAASAQAQQTATASRTTQGGVHKVTFDTLQGRVIVHLPDDMAAGDTISGTVVAEPKGSTEEERSRNADTLNGYVVEIGGTRASRGNRTFEFALPPARGNLSGHIVKIVDSASGKEVAGISVPPSIPATRGHRTACRFELAGIGQHGRPVEIFGPFDGNASNTTVTFGPARSTVQDFEKNTENVSGGFGLIRPLAESPRKMVFESPTNVTGPVQLMLKEGDAKTLAPYRNVGVRLSAPKTNLTKGEQTALTVQVSGLEGIRNPVPLQLDAIGVITMDAGNFQNLRITPAEVNRDGTYTTTRAITGQQAGAFTVTATVIVSPFDVCLQVK